MQAIEIVRKLNDHGIQTSESEIKEMIGDTAFLTDEDLPQLVELMTADAGKSSGKLAKAQPVQPTQPQPASAIANPEQELQEAQQRAISASIKAAATMGDSTSNLFATVERKLSEKRQARDEQLADQIVDKVFNAENLVLGKSFTGLLNYVAQANPYKGTALENLTGAGTIDINRLLTGE